MIVEQDGLMLNKFIGLKVQIKLFTHHRSHINQSWNKPPCKASEQSNHLARQAKFSKDSLQGKRTIKPCSPILVYAALDYLGSYFGCQVYQTIFSFESVISWYMAHVWTQVDMYIFAFQSYWKSSIFSLGLNPELYRHFKEALLN